LEKTAGASEHHVYAFVKNSKEEVKAYLDVYKGRKLAHLRVFVEGEDGVDHPTKKGLAVRVADLPKLRDAVEALLEAAQL
jgi:hypothetical protein